MQEYWRELPGSPSGHLNLGIESPSSPALQAGSLLLTTEETHDVYTVVFKMDNQQGPTV